MLIRSFSVAVLIAVLAACSSGVKLNDVPVEDKSANAVSNVANASVIGTGSAAGLNNVAGVITAKPAVAAVGPAGGNTVFFDYDSFTLKPEARAVIEKMPNFCKPTSKTKRCWKVIPTSAVDANTTWPWVKSGLSRFAVP